MQSAELLKNVEGLLQLDRSADIAACLNTMREIIHSLIARIQRGEAKQALDLNFRIDDELAKLRELIRATYFQSVNAAVKEAARAAYADVVSLQWAIADHDILFSRRKSGYAASSVEEVEKVLDRIESEE